MIERQIRILSVVATLAAIGMYVSHTPQVRSNLTGNPDSLLRPLAAAINCTLWFVHDFLRRKCDYPIILADAPGVISDLTTLATSF